MYHVTEAQLYSHAHNHIKSTEAMQVMLSNQVVSLLMLALKIFARIIL